MKYVIFDIDGVLANSSHRLHHIQKPTPDWASFFEDSYLDPPIAHNIALYRHLQDHYPMHLITGRAESTRQMTAKWLEKHGLQWDTLHMRPTGDYTQDFIFKQRVVDTCFSPEDTLFVIDDNPGICAMYRRLGYNTFEVPMLEGKHILIVDQFMKPYYEFTHTFTGADGLDTQLIEDTLNYIKGAMRTDGYNALVNIKPVFAFESQGRKTRYEVTVTTHDRESAVHAHALLHELEKDLGNESKSAA